jgi:pimeloyl-ACP methyl ester carboxylesterase
MVPIIPPFDRPFYLGSSTMNQPELRYVVCADTNDAQERHRMAYWQWGDPQAGQVVVCVHGLSRQGRDFDVLAREILRRGAGAALRVVCPDLAGRGQSDWLKDPMRYQPATYAADMLQLLGQLHGQAAIHTLDWVGTSLGGLVGMALCGQRGLPLPVPVRRLVLNDVGPALQFESVQRIAGYIGKTGRFENLQQAADAMWAISSSFGPHTAQQWLDFCRPMVKPHPDDPAALTLHYDPAIAAVVRAATAESVAQGEQALWALYDQIRAQTLLLRGAQSDLLSPDTARQMSLRGPKARVVEFAGIGHAPTLLAADQVGVVADFLLAPVPRVSAP